jgi:tripartite-type tricarboxylate transporter receptor subunit TctC
MRILTLFVVLMALLAGTVHAQTGDFPSRPITMIVPWPAGGQTDLEVRALCATASGHLGQAIVIVNRPGATGSLGAVALASAPPDGYLLSSIPVGVFRQPYLVKMSYDPMTDLSYIIGTSGYPFGVVVRADSPWKSFKELLDYAKANPGKLNFATLGMASTQHITMEKIARQFGI